MGRVGKGKKGKAVKIKLKQSVKKLKNSDGKNLDKIYFDPAHPAGFGSVQKLQKATSLPLSSIQEWASYQEPITLHKQVRHKFSRNKIKVLTIDHQWQADLCDMRKYADDNNGYKYLLTVIDCFSKYAWAVPLKSKQSHEIINAFTEIFKFRKCMKLQCDKGTEFINKPVQAFLKSENVHFFTADNPDIKASMVERFNRTLKTKMWKYFTHTKTTKYIDVLEKLLISYNNSYHSSIKMAPVEVNKLNILDVYKTLYGKEKSVVNTKFKFQVGDHVRIKKEKLTFEKGYESNFTQEIFIISERISRAQPVYKVTDLKGEQLSSIFYEPELIKVGKIDYRKKFEIEKVLERKGNKVLVQWKGFPSSFNEWIPKKKGL